MKKNGKTGHWIPGDDIIIYINKYRKIGCNAAWIAAWNDSIIDNGLLT